MTSPALWLVSALALVALAPPGPEEIDLAPYLPFGAGNRWIYSGPDGSKLVFELAPGSPDRPGLWHRSGSDGTGRVESYHAERGYEIHRLHTSEDEVIQYERPVVLLPARMKEGEVHTSQRRFVLRRDGEKQDVGAHYFEAELLGTEALETPLGILRDCLKVRRSVLRMDYSGPQTGYQITEWYARDLGVVKVRGERFFKDASGAVVRTEPIDLALEESNLRP